MGSDFTVLFAVYPDVTQLDFTGPYEVFMRLPGARCIVASVNSGSVEADGGLTFAGLHRLKDVESCALLCVPNGRGTIQALEDRRYLGEVRRLATLARYETSVCTGAQLLAAAGLLTGRRAACHWAWRDCLSHFGAIPDSGRVVRDGNVITGGGVTAGIDMALSVIGEIAGADYAQAVTLEIEYSPMPPFDPGRPERARAEIVAQAQTRVDTFRAERVAVIRRAAAALSDSLGKSPLV